VQRLNKHYSRKVDQMPPPDVLNVIGAKVDMATLERVLMNEGTKKFSDPQKNLISLIAFKRAATANEKRTIDRTHS
jgi:transaldolase